MQGPERSGLKPPTYRTTPAEAGSNEESPLEKEEVPCYGAQFTSAVALAQRGLRQAMRAALRLPDHAL
jgi:hypothetical protein